MLERSFLAFPLAAGAALPEHVRLASSLVGIDLAGCGYVRAGNDGEAMLALVAAPSSAGEVGVTRRPPGTGQRVWSVRLENHPVDDDKAAGSGLGPKHVRRPI